MSAEEKRSLEDAGVPAVGKKNAAPKPPVPPKVPKPSRGKDAKDKDEMPDLDQFNFMSW